jgi:DNA-directed RNA polymerase specialized sigma24 family protein
VRGEPKLETVERISEESRLRIEELYATHAQGAVRLAYLLVGDLETAQDVAQEAFVRAFGRFANLRKPDSFPTYLTSTIVNLTRKHFKRKGLERLFVDRLRARPVPRVAPPNVEPGPPTGAGSCAARMGRRRVSGSSTSPQETPPAWPKAAGRFGSTTTRCSSTLEKCPLTQNTRPNGNDACPEERAGGLIPGHDL